MSEKVRLTKESWKSVVGYESILQVSDAGNLRTLDRTIIDKNGINKNIKGKLLKQSTSKQGYKTICFRSNGQKKNFLVHRLVAGSFLDNKENKPYVNHIDGNKINNDIGNLEWCTNSENIRHAHKMGLKKPSNPNKNNLMEGEKHHNSKLTDDDVSFIRLNSKWSGGSMKNTELAKMFRTTKSTIGYVVKNKTWKHIS